MGHTNRALPVNPREAPQASPNARNYVDGTRTADETENEPQRDIVEQLRSRAKDPWDDTDVFDDLDRFVMDMAADEIERLRHALKDDGHRPHRFPPFAPGEDTECIAWECAACGKRIDEGSTYPDNCPIDWRKTGAST